MAHLAKINLKKLTQMSLNELIHRSIYTTAVKVSFSIFVLIHQLIKNCVTSSLRMILTN